jgi:hypothetical protein
MQENEMVKKSRRLLGFALLLVMLAAGQSVHTITVDRSHPLNVFDPAEALGAGIDGHEKATLPDC